MTGSKRPLWGEIIAFLTSSYRVREDLKYYGKSYGWMVQYRQGGKLLLSIYPKRDGLAAQMILSEMQMEAARSLPPGELTRKAMREARHYPEGC